MEELKLEDLDFDNSTFDESNQGVQQPEEKAEELENKPDGDGEQGASQESVADQSKENNQVQTGNNPENGEGSNSSSPKLNENEQLYSTLAAEFKAKGVLPGLEDIDGIKSLEDINNALQAEVDARLDATQKTLREAMNSGADVSEVAKISQTISKLESVTDDYIENEDNAAFRLHAIKQDFIINGYSEERASVMAQRSIDAGTDVEDAKFALASIIEDEKDNMRGLIDGARKKEEDSLEEIKNYISTTPEVLPGIALTDSQKSELYNQVISDVGGNETAFMKAQTQDPMGTRMKLEALFYVTKGFKDFSVFSAPGVTNSSNNLENLLRGAKFTQDGKINTDIQDENSNFMLKDLKDFTFE